MRDSFVGQHKALPLLAGLPATLSLKQAYNLYINRLRFFTAFKMTMLQT